MSGARWQLARVGVVICFALACGLLVVSLASPSKAFGGPFPSPTSNYAAR